MRCRSFLLGAAVTLLVGAAIGAGARHLVAKDPAVVVHVRLEQVFSEIDEMKQVRQALSDEGARIEADLRTRQDNLKKMQADLEALVPGSDQHKQLREKLMFEAATLEAWGNLRQRELLNEESRQYQAMYRKISNAIARLSESEGYHYVILADRTEEFRQGQTSDIVAQMFERKMLYGHDSRDVTEQLITRMNNAFAAAQGR